ncbi:MAG: hypothetical protein ABIO62_02935, partial [Paracoccaceae bacterium]
TGMLIVFMAFGLLCGATAAILTFAAGAGLVAAFAAYACVGAAGVLLIALLPGSLELDRSLTRYAPKLKRAGKSPSAPSDL